MATLLISSKNYSSWSLRGFLLARLARLDFEEQVVASDDPNTRAELLLRASSIRVPCLVHDGVTVWDTLAIAEYLNEVCPERRHVSGRPHGARALPLDLGRDAFGLLRAAFVAADEPAHRGPAHRHLVRGAGRHRPHHRDLARMPGHLEGPVAVRPDADGRRCHVCPGGRPFPQLWRSARSGLRGVLRRISGPGPTSPSGSPRRSSSRSRSRNWKSSSDAGAPGDPVQGMRARNRTGPSTSSVLKSAGPTTSRYWRAVGLPQFCQHAPPVAAATPRSQHEACRRATRARMQ